MKKVKSKTIQKDKTAYFFLLPFFLVFLIFNLYPIIYTLYLSFTSYDGFAEPLFVGLKNYSRVLKDPKFYDALKNTLVMWLGGAIPQIIFAYLLSAIFSYNKIKGKGLFRAIFYVPRLVTAVSVSALFSQMLSYPSGVVNQVLTSLHLIEAPINFLAGAAFSQGTVSFILWWMWYGNTMVMVMSGMTSISPSYYEAAKIDGANAWQMFWKITFPLLQPITIFVLLNTLVSGLQSFEVQQILSGGMGNPKGKLVTVVMYLYNTAFKYNNYGYGAAIAYYLFVFIAFFSSFILIARLRERREN